MLVKTKYDIGQDVWVLESQSIRRAKIVRIGMEVSSFGCRANYYTDRVGAFPEEKLFQSREALVNHLLGNG